jgi:hypothetical protein
MINAAARRKVGGGFFCPKVSAMQGRTCVFALLCAGCNSNGRITPQAWPVNNAGIYPGEREKASSSFNSVGVTCLPESKTGSSQNGSGQRLTAFGERNSVITGINPGVIHRLRLRRDTTV